MASRTRRFLHSPLRVVLILQALAGLVTLAVLIVGLVRHKSDPSASGPLATLGGALVTGAAGAGGVTLLWAILIPLAALLVASLVFGLVYGRWGLPGYLQGRAVYFVPPLAAIYFAVGCLVLFAVEAGGLGGGWGRCWSMLGTAAGLTLMLIYVSLSTAAVGVGWAVALAVTHHKRSRGKWETIGYVEGSP